jgi:hypothetical protein
MKNLCRSRGCLSKRVRRFKRPTFTLKTCKDTDVAASTEKISCGDGKGVTRTVTAGASTKSLGVLTYLSISFAESFYQNLRGIGRWVSLSKDNSVGATAPVREHHQQICNVGNAILVDVMIAVVALTDTPAVHQGKKVIGINSRVEVDVR